MLTVKSGYGWNVGEWRSSKGKVTDEQLGYSRARQGV